MHLPVLLVARVQILRLALCSARSRVKIDEIRGINRSYQSERVFWFPGPSIASYAAGWKTVTSAGPAEM